MKVAFAPDMLAGFLLLWIAVEAAILRRMGRSEPKGSGRKRGAQKDKWQIAFEKYPRPTWVFDQETLRFLAVSQRAVRHYGYSSQEFLSMTIKDISLAEDVPRLLEYLGTAGETPDSGGIWTHRKKDGSSIDMEIFLEPIDFGGKPAWLEVAQDIRRPDGSCIRLRKDVTQQKRVEDALRTVEAKLREMTVSISDCLWSAETDSQGRRCFPPAARKTTGRPPRFFMVSPGKWFGIIHPEDRARMKEALQKLLEPRRFRKENEHQISGTDGNVRRASNSIAAAWLDNEGIPLNGAVGALTYRRRAEETLRKLSGRLLHLQDEEQRRLARALHEGTAQSLAALIMNLGLLRQTEGALGDRERRALLESLALAKECSKQVRSFSYLLHPPLLDELGLASALNWFAEGFRSRSGIQVDIDLPQDLGRFPQEVETTLFRIVQECFTNILRHSGSSSALVRVVRGASGVTVEVADQGRGILPEVLRKVRRNPAGLGVGVSGMQERLRPLGGTLEIDSNSSGTTVRAIVPFGKRCNENPPNSDSRRPRDCKKGPANPAVQS